MTLMFLGVFQKALPALPISIALGAMFVAATHFVVTHGTDTMPETAKALIGIEGKTIVLTGALTPARFKTTDASFNVGMAVAAAQTAPPGVYIAMSGQVFAAGEVRKNRAENRFEAL